MRSQICLTIWLVLAVQLCMSASIVRRNVDSTSSVESSEEDFEGIKNQFAKLLTEEQNKQLVDILGKFNSTETTLEQKVEGLVQLLELGLSTASAHVGTAANNTNEQKVAENKI